jgi:predicted amidohydrolase
MCGQDFKSALMAVFTCHFLQNLRGEIKRNDAVIVSSYLILAKYHKSHLPATCERQWDRRKRRWGGEPEINKKKMGTTH